MYRFGIRLDSFGRIPEPVAAGLVAGFVEQLARVNVAYLEAHPDTLPLYAAGVRYVTEEEDRWEDLPGVYSARRADCEDLSAIRLAELWRAGELGARAIVELQEYSGGVEYHALIRRGDGSLEDPSEILGM